MSGNTHRILVVDDDPALRDVVAVHLKKRGFEVTAVESAEAVLRMLRDQTLEYDVALTDVHLPGMSGVELSRLLLVTEPLRPVIMITGDDDDRLAQRALSYGATGYLLKPFQLFELDGPIMQAVCMRDLMETTQTLARSQAMGADDWGEAGGLLPRAWLQLVEDQSGAGTGHGARVVRVSGLLARHLGDRLNSRDRDVLETAGRTHEIGRLMGPAEGEKLARWTAQLLLDLGFDPDVAEVVRQAAQPWSPGLSLSARILGMADRLDHDAVRRAGKGGEDREAIRAAVDTIAGQGGETVDPELVELLREQRESLESMWVLQREVGAA